MPIQKTCPECGVPLPLNSPHGLCPGCLLRGQIGPAQFDEPEIEGPGSAAPSIPSTFEKEGDRIGHYRLLQKIGEGGCGVVYMAEQEEPIRRKVALKVIKLGMDTKQVIARFEAERQALALMDHPNIAKVLDAGATVMGRPFFVMELVRGTKITHYCDQHELSTGARLDLFNKVCQAVQHAHQKGVIHRDIKPSNVLVTENDNGPVPKIIDFGIAKATTDQRLTDKTFFTAFEQFLGTPAYMSPEQAKLTGLDIDTRSDIYSLGVLLYELLTGSTPFEATRLLAAGLDEVRRIIREEEPVRPSTRLLTLSAVEQTTIAKQRQSDPPKLMHIIRGDLDWIVMKALEKDRTRRYETANGLFMDIHRYLNSEPVLARPPSHFYRFQKVVRRNRGPFVAAAIVVSALVFVVVVSLWQTVRAKQAEREQFRLREEAQKSERSARQAQAGEAKERQAASEARREAEADRTRLAQTLDQFELQRAEGLILAGEASKGLAHLARMLQRDPDNKLAAERLLSALTLRRFALGLTEPLRQEGRITSAHFSPDGARIATASVDGTSRIWDAQTSEPLGKPMRHGGVVQSARFSPDGKRVVTASDENTARVWDAQTGQPLTEPLKHDAPISSAEFSIDGERVLTTSSDGVARVWDAQTSRVLVALKFTNAVMSMQFSADKRRLLVTCFDNTAQVWDVQTSQALAEPVRHDGRITSAQFSPDGGRVVTTCAKLVRIWDAETGQPAFEPLRHESSVFSAEFSPDGQKVVTVSEDKTARIWDAQSGQPLTPPLRQGGIVSARFSPDGQRMVTVWQDKIVRLCNGWTGDPVLERLTHKEPVWDVQFSPDGKRLVTLLTDGTARVWDVSSWWALREPFKSELTEPAQSKVREEPAIMGTFSPDGQKVVTASFDGTARVWDSHTGQPLTAPLKHARRVHSAQFSPDGKRVVTASYDRTARVWDAQTGQPLTSPLEHGSDVETAQFSPDGQRIVTASDDKMARIWDSLTGQPLTEPLKHESDVYFAQFSPDGLKVVTASYDKTARIWDAHTGQPLTESLKHEGPIRSAEFSPDGKRVVTASDVGTARIWDAQTGQSVTELLKHDAGVNFARFSPDGQLVATASDDGTARIWNSHTGQPRSEALKHGGSVRSVEFSPDGSRVVTASFDGTARVWDVKTGQPLTEALDHEGWVWTATFDQGGQRVLTTSSGTTARVWDVPFVPMPVPEWVPELTEMVVGERVVDYHVERIEFAPVLPLVKRILASPATNVWTRWAKWFFADPRSRAISPFSNVTVVEYVQHLLKEGSLPSLQEAVILAPTNGLAFARLALAVMAQTPSENPRQIGEAEWDAGRALQFAPDEPEAWWARAAALERAGKLSAALEAIKGALRLQPQNPDFWLAQGRMLEETNGVAAAYLSFSNAIELAGKPGPISARFYLNRSNFLKRQNRLKEAAQDYCLGKDFPFRDEKAVPEQVDLTFFFDGWLNKPWHPGEEKSDLVSLPTGIQVFAGVTFDVRGLVQVGSTSRAGEKYPIRVENIPIGRGCKKLHFLHSAINCATIDKGEKIGSYVIRYADGNHSEIPIILGQDVGDWWNQPNEESDKFVIAWEGTNEASQAVGRRIRLFKTTWENPSPTVPIKSIDFLCTHKTAAPFLVAITTE